MPILPSHAIVTISLLLAVAVGGCRTAPAPQVSAGPPARAAIKPATWSGTTRAAHAALRSGECERAEALFEQALSEAERVWVFNQRYGTSVRNLAQMLDVYVEDARYGDSERVADRILASATRVYGDDSLAVAFAQERLASVYVYQQRESDAEKIILEAYSIRESQKTADISVRLEGLFEVSSFYSSRLRYQEANEQMMRADALCATQRPGHPCRGLVLQRMAWLRLQEGRLVEAGELGREASEVIEKTLGRSSHLMAVNLSTRGEIAAAQGETARALVLLEESGDAIRNAVGTDHPAQIDTLTLRAQLLRQTGRDEEAEVLEDEMMRIETSLGGPRCSTD